MNIRYFLILMMALTLTAGSGFSMNWQTLDRDYYYNGNDLGCTFLQGVASFRLWAPTAHSVKLVLFHKDSSNTTVLLRDMNQREKGTWTTQLTPANSQIDDLEGYYYQYEITDGNGTRRVLDPYAKSMAAFQGSKVTLFEGSCRDATGKGAIVCSQRRPPSLFTNPHYTSPQDAIIWEIHVRDFTSSPDIEDSLTSRWGTYSAFIDALPYIKSLGVTHVQLLPVMAWYYGDETAMDKRDLTWSAASENYNWGYDPHNYFSPDGGYSENPQDPQLRINELKTLINEIHKAGMSVILDVVYTHMAKADFLEDIVPDYYFFKDSEGTFVGGFGNNLATNRLMARKLIVDSVKYWFSTYGIDGMRWDMMGDATSSLVQEAFQAAQEINPQALFIGEGWRTFSGHLDTPSLEGTAADQDWMAHTDDVAVFSDEFRNELKSGFGCEGEPRFLTGGPRAIKDIYNNIIANPSNTPNTIPANMVTYIAAHDNLPLYDVIAQSIKKDPAIPENDKEILKRIRLGNAMVLVSQGVAFLHGGQEYGRTKQWLGTKIPEQKYHVLKDDGGNLFKNPWFIHDSYNSSDRVNMFDHLKATDRNTYPENVKTVDYTRGLIALRKSTDAFSHKTFQDIEKNLTLLDFPETSPVDLVIGFTAKASSGETYTIFINGDSKVRKLSFHKDLRSLFVLVDGEKAGVEPLHEKHGFVLHSKSIELEPLTMVVFSDKKQ